MLRGAGRQLEGVNGPTQSITQSGIDHAMLCQRQFADKGFACHNGMKVYPIIAFDLNNGPRKTLLNELLNCLSIHNNQPC